MAAFRRLISTSTNFSSTSGRFVFWKQTPKRTKTFKRIATGVCIATGAGFANYYNVQKKLSTQIDNGLLLALPAVSATNKILADTPPVFKGSSNLFRNLRHRGIIGYTEYLFLLCILTKPHAGFKIAFNMFDADGNQMVDKREFLVLEEIFRKKKDRKEAADGAPRSDKLNMQLYGNRESRAQRVSRASCELRGSQDNAALMGPVQTLAVPLDIPSRADDLCTGLMSVRVAG
ncbi:unnamed protein product [Coregonus sp. 'balchen']|nr:unnamed protein product [Coregonus sp. 'balchen']